MSKTLEAIRLMPHVMAVDDERNMGNSIIVTLKKPYCFKAEKGCGVRDFDTVSEAKRECSASHVYHN